MITLNGVKSCHLERENGRSVLRQKILQTSIYTVKPDNKTDEEWNLLHRQVCVFIRQWIDDNVLNYISRKTHSNSTRTS